MGGSEESAAESYVIGVLAKRGEQIAMDRWTLTADYLTQQVPAAQFHVSPLTFEQIEPAIRSGKIDFLLANSGIYIQAEHRFGAFRIATLVNHSGDYALTQFGGVIFTRARNPSLQSLYSLRDKSFAAVNPTSLGGYLMARQELLEQGIDTEQDMTLNFLGTHDAVVKAVLAGQADAGTVRSDTIERMAAGGLIRLDRIKVLKPRDIEGFPYRLSTRLYPEWPMAALPHTPKSLVEKVSTVLLNMPPDHPAALTSDTRGWTVPANYQPVHELYRTLNLAPHRREPPSLDEWTQHNPATATVTISSLLLLLISLLTLLRYNRRLTLTQQDLSHAIHNEHMIAGRLKENLTHLQQSEEKFIQLAESALDAIIMLDPQGRVEFWNSAAIKIFGYTLEEAQNTSPDEWLTSANDKVPQTNDILRYIGNSSSPMPGTTLELEATRKSGETFPIEAALSSVMLNGGWYVICLIRDITQRKEMEAERQRMELHLSQHHKMTALAQLANGIAHEINTPIQTISNNLGFLKEAFEDSRELVRLQRQLVTAAQDVPQLAARVDKCKKLCDEIDLEFLEEEVATTLNQSQQGTEQVSRIVRSMRVFANTDNPTPEKTDLGKLIQDVLAISRHLWHPSARIVTQSDANLPLVSCFPGELHQAVLNLLLNAVQAIEDKPGETEGEITIASRYLGNKVQIEISDNGNGIPEEARAHIFNPFFTTRDVGKGTGQGLTLSHDIVVQKHGGTLDFKTETGKGTTFYLQLPMEPVS